jgi:methyltransferase (TIGR00027 family)
MKRNGTAQYTALARATDGFDYIPAMKSPDGMAPLFLGGKFALLRLLGRSSLLREAIRRAYAFLAPGMGPYLIARTKHFDAALLAALESGTRQVVFLGAGYDSRPYRFLPLLEGITAIEVDHPETARRKMKILRRAFGSIPSHVRFIQADLDSDRLSERLRERGFDRNKKTLFLWEGVAMYLAPKTVERVFDFVAEESSQGSMIVFDFTFAQERRSAAAHYGGGELVSFLERLGEPIRFSLDPSSASAFIEARGLELVSYLNPESIDERYLRDASGIQRRSNGLFGIIHARRPENRPVKA